MKIKYTKCNSERIYCFPVCLSFCFRYTKQLVHNISINHMLSYYSHICFLYCVLLRTIIIIKLASTTEQ